MVLVEGRDAEPGRAHRPLRRGDLLDRAADALVAGDDRAGEHRREHRRSRSDPGGGEQDGRSTVRQPDPGEAKGIAEPAEVPHDSYAATCAHPRPLMLLRVWLSFAYARRQTTAGASGGGPARLDRGGRRLAALHAVRGLPAAGEARGGGRRAAARAGPEERAPHAGGLAPRRACGDDPRAARRRPRPSSGSSTAPRRCSGSAATRPRRSASSPTPSASSRPRGPRSR